MSNARETFLKDVIETIGPSGYEQSAQSVWRKYVSQFSDVKLDELGSAVAVVNSTGSPKVVLEAHIDEIGFLVRYIDDNGYVYFSPIGGLDPATLAGNRVQIIGINGPVRGVVGRKPIHLIERDERSKMPKIKDFWIDVGASNRAEAEKLLSVGDAGGREHGIEQMQGNYIAASSLDDRIGSFVIAEALRNIAGQSPHVAVYAISAVQEEIGLRGAGPAAYSVNAPIGIAVDVTFTSDHPGTSAAEVGEIKCGGGPVISRGAANNPHIVQRLIAAAHAEEVPYQIDADPTGRGTDEYAMQTVRGGMATGLVSIATRYLHTASEVLNMDDVEGAIKVLTRFILDIQGELDLAP